ncbi:MAG: acyl-CoA dehydrogenase [Actinobacteria bacterium]|nr:acyl-CoA dehydrogenase [Actinomycetota bacterium]
MSQTAERSAIEDLGEFRGRAVEFLEAHASQIGGNDEFVWGEGDDFVGIVEEGDPETEAASVAAARAWAALRFDAGFGWIDGPAELGGGGLTGAHLRAYRSLESRYDLPDQSVFTIGLGMVAPTIAAHARPDVAAQYLAPLHRGDVIACQLFSEPGAGSDLASLSTRAVADGDEWVVDGQKVWTSNAHHAGIGEIICRTDPDAPKHAGMTAFIVDMHAPGVEVRPLRQMTGGAGFNEVFFTGVRIPDSHRLGAVGEGWGVALTTLMNERASIGSGMGLAKGPGPFERLVALTRHVGADADPVTRDRLARLYTTHVVNGLTAKRATAALRSGGLPGPELSILKLAGTEHLLAIADYVAGVLGPALCADTGEWGTFAWTKLVCGVPGGRLGGGSDEIVRNIIGERVLGLPREPR